MSISRVDGPGVLHSGTCRRYGTRYVPVRRDACLAWWSEAFDGSAALVVQDTDATIEFRDQEPEPRHLYALLIDISLNGASVAVDQVPPPGRPVWFSLECLDRSDWVEAEVVGTILTNRGPHIIRLSFRSDCRFETIQTAICG